MSRCRKNDYYMQTFAKKIATVGIFAAALLSTVTFGQPTGTTPTRGLDLVLLLDRSPSANAKSLTKNGPRFVDRAAAVLLEKVSDLSSFRDVDFRLAATNFGGKCGIGFELKRIHRSEVPSIPAFERIKNTDFNCALEFAASIFKLPQDAQRHRAVVLVTDAEPHPAKGLQSLQARQAYFDARHIRELVRSLDASGAKIYVIAFQDSAEDAGMWKSLVSASSYQSIDSSTLEPAMREVTEDILRESRHSVVASVKSDQLIGRKEITAAKRQSFPIAQVIIIVSAILSSIIAIGLLRNVSGNSHDTLEMTADAVNSSQEIDLREVQELLVEAKKLADDNRISEADTKIDDAMRNYDETVKHQNEGREEALDSIYEAFFAIHKDDTEEDRDRVRQYVIEQVSTISTPEKARALGIHLGKRWSLNCSAFTDEFLLVLLGPRGLFTLEAISKLDSAELDTDIVNACGAALSLATA